MPDHSLSKPTIGFDESDRPPSRRTTRERLLVLVVDDDVIALEVARERLERLGLDVVTRDQSLGTSRWILENKPDFVLLDLQMPALTGAELARLIRRHMTGIIVHSSLSSAELARVARDVGAIGGIEKGLSDKDFAREMSRLMRQARAGIEGAP
jgi:CheY-like chemotaxis protein